MKIRTKRRIKRTIKKAAAMLAIMIIFVAIIICFCGFNNPDVSPYLPLQVTLICAPVAAITILCIALDEKQEDGK